MKIVENLFFYKNIMVNSSFIEKNIGCRDTLVLPNRGNSSVYLQHMLLKITKTILKFTFIPSIMPIVFASLNISNC